MKIEKGSIKHLIIQIIATVVFCFALFPLLDLLWSAIFSNSKFNWNVRDHIIDPIIYGSIAAIVFWFFDKGKAKK